MWPEEKKKFVELIKEDETFRDASLFFGEPKTSEKENKDFLAAVLLAHRKRRKDIWKEHAPKKNLDLNLSDTES